MSTNPIDVTCSFCGAKPGEGCQTKAGKPFRRVGDPDTTFHNVRLAIAVNTDEGFPPPLDIARLPLPHKLRHRVRAHGYVWCDHHCGIHDASIDSFGEGADECKPINWRRVYVETDDKSETF